tara:strand:- start:6 stop:401 length:396 start_codon:yes stop_codon:yes gene_type:complete
MVLYGTEQNGTQPVKIVCETEGYLITTTDKSIDTNLIFNGAGMNAGTSVTIDCNGYRAIRIWGDISNEKITITATNANNIGNAGFWDSFDESATGPTIFNFYYPDAPRYLRINNLSASTITTLNLQYARFK